MELVNLAHSRTAAVADSDRLRLWLQPWDVIALAEAVSVIVTVAMAVLLAVKH